MNKENKEVLVKVRNLSNRRITHGMKYKLEAGGTIDVPKDVAEIWKTNFPNDILVGEEANPEVLQNKDAEIAELKAEIIKLNETIIEVSSQGNLSNDEKLTEANNKISELSEDVKAKDEAIKNKDSEIENLKAEIVELKKTPEAPEASKTEEEIAKEERRALFEEAKTLGITHSNAISTEDLKAKIAEHKEAGK